MSMRVAVIGAGASGLAAARRLIQCRIEVVVFEQHENVGGVWLPLGDRPSAPLDGKGFREKVMDSKYLDLGSPLYNSLVTNLPCELMAYRELPFREAVDVRSTSTSSFVTAEEVEKYLLAYTDKFQLRNVIRFGQSVMSLKPKLETLNDNNAKPKWLITAKSVQSPVNETEEEFDAVLVCNGHYNTRFVPEELLDQVTSWNGVVLHAKDYRSAEEFKNQVVVVVGAKSSGTDISRELANVATKVVMCDTDCPVDDRDPRVAEFQLEQLGEGHWGFSGELRGKLEWRSALTGLQPDSNGVEFLKGNPLNHADTVIFATGYRYTFPFLDETIVNSHHGMVRPLFMQMIHTKYHNLHFLGLPFSIVPFPFVEIQATLSANLFLGIAELPDPNVVLEEELEIQNNLNSGRIIYHWHKLNAKQWAFCRRILDLANAMDPEWDEILNWREKVYSTLSKIRSSEHPGGQDHFRSLSLARILKTIR